MGVQSFEERVMQAEPRWDGDGRGMRLMGADCAIVRNGVRAGVR